MKPKIYTQEELDSIIERWHSGENPEPQLHKALGWTWDDYVYWVMTKKQPAELTLRERLKLRRRRLIKR